MNPPSKRDALLVLLALVFTIGLTFATVELPYVIDGFLMDLIQTPGFDSHADDMSLFRTELFIDHYRLRLIGYLCFSLTVLLILLGFATRRQNFAAVGAIACMLPVFAQFAGVMFFLAGLGILNVPWLPLLDISFETQRLGLVIRFPFDALMWLFRQVGINAYWPLVCACIGCGLLMFFLGTFAWLAARARRKDVADFWVYRISRHPQYLGWILWTYGAYLLLEQGLYPMRSWGISASLPWLVSTMVIIGVALLEELNMLWRYGDTYEDYRRRVPFLLPLPVPVTRLFALPLRLLFGKDQPERRREVAVVVVFYAVLLIGASSVFYGGGWEGLSALLRAGRPTESSIKELATRLNDEPNARVKYFVARRLASYGDHAVDSFVALLTNGQDEVRVLSSASLAELRSTRAVSALINALGDPVADVRANALAALGAIRPKPAAAPLWPLLDDPAPFVRTQALRTLAELGETGIVERATGPLEAPEAWVRIATVESLGILGSRQAVPALARRLTDDRPEVRRATAVSLARIGSQDAREALERASHDSDWEVRIYAAEALKRLGRATPE